MNFDNRVFNVNVDIRESDFFSSVIALAFDQAGCETAKSFEFNPKHGLILLWTLAEHKSYPFPVPLKAQAVAAVAYAWLFGEQAKTVIFDGWDADEEHDGSNSPGWRVYCEDWGHVAGNYGAICAVRPAFVWHGK